MRYRLLISGLLLNALLVTSPVSAATITFESAVVKANESFTVSIVGTDLIDLFAFNFDFAFDPSIVGTPTVARGDVFADLGEPCDFCFFGGDSSGPGVVGGISDFIFIADSGFTGAGVLAILTFQATASGGNAGLGLLNVFLSDPNSNQLDAVVKNGVVRVDALPTPVPEPSTLGLLGIGLATMARRMRRRTPSTESSAH